MLSVSIFPANCGRFYHNLLTAISSLASQILPPITFNINTIWRLQECESSYYNNYMFKLSVIKVSLSFSADNDQNYHNSPPTRLLSPVFTAVFRRNTVTMEAQFGFYWRSQPMLLKFALWKSFRFSAIVCFIQNDRNSEPRRQIIDTGTVLDQTQNRQVSSITDNSIPLVMRVSSTGIDPSAITIFTQICIYILRA